MIGSFSTFFLDPNVIFSFFVVAMLCLYIEISHPGAILPGVVGSCALLIFLFTAGSIFPNWFGLAFMTLAFLLLVLDVHLPIHGIFTVGAAVSLMGGAFIFFNSGGSHDRAQVYPQVIYIMGALVGLIGFLVFAARLWARRRGIRNGLEGMIGANVIVKTPLVPEGRVSYNGEDWAAMLDDPTISTISIGSEVQVVAVEGLRLRIQPVRTLPILDTYVKIQRV